MFLRDFAEGRKNWSRRRVSAGARTGETGNVDVLGRRLMIPPCPCRVFSPLLLQLLLLLFLLVVLLGRAPVPVLEVRCLSSACDLSRVDGPFG